MPMICSIHALLQFRGGLDIRQSTLYISYNNRVDVRGRKYVLAQIRLKLARAAGEG